MADALGMIEARSFAAMVEAADAMVKAAKVAHVIARPHVNIDVVLPLGRREQAQGEQGQGS